MKKKTQFHILYWVAAFLELFLFQEFYIVNRLTKLALTHF